MDLIIDFFEWHGFLPSERFERSLGRELIKNRKRTEAAIAIIRDIEKSQTKPTNAMLQLLFQESDGQNETKEEPFDFGQQELMTENEELNYYRKRYEEAQQLYFATTIELKHIVDNTSYVKGSFGGGYFKLEITKEEFENYKQKLDYVHNDYKTDN
tara:strand:+ start:986 stop:1453 length:468 start_codon:yes stop_codon:yes gene_type:complete